MKWNLLFPASMIQLLAPTDSKNHEIRHSDLQSTFWKISAWIITHPFTSSFPANEFPPFQLYLHNWTSGSFRYKVVSLEQKSDTLTHTLHSQLISRQTLNSEPSCEPVINFVYYWPVGPIEFPEYLLGSSQFSQNKLLQIFSWYLVY